MLHTTVQSLLGTMREVYEGGIDGDHIVEANDLIELIEEARIAIDGAIAILRGNPDNDIP